MCVQLCRSRFSTGVRHIWADISIGFDQRPQLFEHLVELCLCKSCRREKGSVALICVLAIDVDGRKVALWKPRRAPSTRAQRSLLHAQLRSAKPVTRQQPQCQ